MFKKYFIPHRGNDHKPHVLRERSVGALVAAALVLFAVSLGGSVLGPAIHASKLGAAIYASILVDLTNASRADSAGTTPLATSALLAKAAQMKADDMALHS